MAFLSSLYPAFKARILLCKARHLLKRGKGLKALKAAEQAAALDVKIRNLHFVRGCALDFVGRHEEAKRALEVEICRFPSSAKARNALAALEQASSRQRQSARGLSRRFGTSLGNDVLQEIQKSLHEYSYRGVPMLKNPFDMAIYPLLIWETKPQTIIEVGSKAGGSALWFADMVSNFGLETRIYSIDIVKVESVSHPRVDFRGGDGRDLAASLDSKLLNELPRPWLVIEDADHAYETSIKVLQFFHPWLRSGEYIVVEDGIISDLTMDGLYNSGPHRAIKQFLRENEGLYDIDPRYCDYFGYNLTWCTNGFLRKC